jgi:hypothetical protein
MTTGGGRQVLVNIRVTLSTPSVLGNAALLVRGFSRNGIFRGFSRYIIDLAGRQIYVLRWAGSRGDDGWGQGAHPPHFCVCICICLKRCFDVEG